MSGARNRARPSVRERTAALRAWRARELVLEATPRIVAHIDGRGRLTNVVVSVPRLRWLERAEGAP